MPRAKTKELEEIRRKKISNKLKDKLKGKMPKNINIFAGWNKGKKCPWVSEVNKKRFTGKKLSEKHKRHIRENHADNSGKKSPWYGKTGALSANWKGGIAKASTKKWREKNYNRVLYLNLRRRARKKGAEGSHTFEEWENLKKEYNYMCLCCKKFEPEIKLTEDHIIPLTKGGNDYIENIQPLCRSCNSIKYNKTINYVSLNFIKEKEYTNI